MAQRTTTIETPVLIVGGGPVGLALAADLGLRGTPCLLIEQGEGPPDHPRASAINARSMEFMRRFGVADAVRAASAPEDFPHTALYCTSLNGFEIARIERPHHGGKGPTPESPERPQRCNQLWLDPILRDLAAAQPGVALRYRCRFEVLQQESRPGHRQRARPCERRAGRGSSPNMWSTAAAGIARSGARSAFR